MKKRIAIVGIVAALIGAAIIARGADYTVTLSTYNPLGSTAEYTAGAYPNISGTVQLRSLILANNGPMETVSLYDTCTSSTAATLAATFIVGSSTTYPASGGNQFPARLFILTSPCIKKSTTTTDLKATLIYDTTN